MISNKQKEESKNITKKLIANNKIVKTNSYIKNFFLNKAINSLQISKRLLEISNNLNDSLEGYMWVINSSYYSMFFAATALLAYFDHRIKETQGIHKLTFHALVYYCLIDDNKLEKHFIEEYKDVYEDAEQLLQISQTKAVELVKSLDFEREKRTKFTYEVGKVAEKNKAETSFKRADEFLIEVRKLIEE